MSDLEILNPANAAYLEEIYERYRGQPGSVARRWADLFESLENGLGPVSPPVAAAQRGVRQVGVYDLIHSYRELGHFVADLDPLGHSPRQHPLLEFSQFGLSDADLDHVVDTPTFRGCPQASVEDLLGLLRDTYCRTLGVEYMDISDKRQRDWLQERMEPDCNRPRLSIEDRRRILAQVTSAEIFEQFLHTRYVGQKRFSLEGGEALIPLLDTLIEDGAALGVEEMVMGMAHRGRLNVLFNILGKPPEYILSEFEGTLLPRGVQGDGDVKYHLGYSRDYVTRADKPMHLSLSFNPSHLEAVDPVVEGIVRAKQRHRGDLERGEVVPVLIHGDAAFSGQGVVAETLILTDLPAYQTGGTIHVIIDNQIGFTASPCDFRYTRYASDVARSIQAPVFHVNGDDPEAAVQAARLAIAFRQYFKLDVIIDLICYRRHGHNEGDDPTFTQPVMYREIKEHPTPRHLYAERLVEAGVVTGDEAEQEAEGVRDLLRDAMDYARDFMPRQQVLTLGGLWQGMSWAGSDWSAASAVPLKELREIAENARRVPEGFRVHSKVRRLMGDRVEMVQPGGQIDWGCAEMLAFGSLLLEGVHVRLSGQDAGRGTFSHRHAVLSDQETGATYVPLDHLGAHQERFHVIDTMLSEEAVLGFEYGYSTADPRNLVIWEAQFGDFANGAQVVIDQFISSAESKWQRMSGIVLLLPHGYEGQGPEHSSARLERFLQLCAEDNLQICNLTTPAQYFHALRRQMLRNFRKPLVLMSPKSLLRHKLCASSPEDLSRGGFQEVLDEADPLDPARVQRVVLCSGKVYYDLLVERRERVVEDIALVRLEQLYPFPEARLAEVLNRYPQASEVYWVQEEPRNMGGWSFIQERLPGVLGAGQSLSYVGREEAASTATGSYKMHMQELTALLDGALGRTHAG